MSNVQVFVYGTLKPGEANYQHYCQGKVRSQVSAYTWGSLYHLSLGYPGMTEGKNKVRGVLLSFNDVNILSSLDGLESYQDNREFELNEYYRQQVPIYSLEDRLLGQAWAYFMTETKVREYSGIPVDSGWWTNLCI
ncbi:MAG: gamma-glutamylcyclotransferase [Pleurocapsa sp.]